jgi:hypothetical protein
MPKSRITRSQKLRSRARRQRDLQALATRAARFDQPVHDCMLMGETRPVARKEYHCQCGVPNDDRHCARTIRPGEKYFRRTYIDLDERGTRGRRGKYHTQIFCAGCDARQGSADDEGTRETEFPPYVAK